MWPPLSDSSHSEGTVCGYEPLYLLVAELRSRWYSDKVYGYWSHLTFTIGAAPSYEATQQMQQPDIVSIEFDPHNEQFIIGHGEPGRPWGQGKENGCWVRVGRWAYCFFEEALLLIDQIVARDLGRRAGAKHIKFKGDDSIVVDAITHIRQHPELYLPWGKVNADSLAACLVTDLLVVPQRLVFSIRIDDWRLIGSSDDWIGARESAEIHAWFYNGRPFPEAGSNSIHAEMLFAAFADDISTFTPQSMFCVSGEAIQMGLVAAIRLSHPDWKRVVAFRCRGSAGIPPSDARVTPLASE